jgi:hypothetical protein
MHAHEGTHTSAQERRSKRRATDSPEPIGRESRVKEIKEGPHWDRRRHIPDTLHHAERPVEERRNGERADHGSAPSQASASDRHMHKLDDYRHRSERPTSSHERSGASSSERSDERQSHRHRDGEHEGRGGHSSPAQRHASRVHGGESRGGDGRTVAAGSDRETARPASERASSRDTDKTHGSESRSEKSRHRDGASYERSSHSHGGGHGTGGPPNQTPRDRASNALVGMLPAALSEAAAHMPQLATAMPSELSARQRGSDGEHRRSAEPSSRRVYTAAYARIPSHMRASARTRAHTRIRNRTHSATYARARTGTTTPTITTNHAHAVSCSGARTNDGRSAAERTSSPIAHDHTRSFAPPRGTAGLDRRRSDWAAFPAGAVHEGGAATAAAPAPAGLPGALPFGTAGCSERLQTPHAASRLPPAPSTSAAIHSLEANRMFGYDGALVREVGAPALDQEVRCNTLNHIAAWAWHSV